MVPIQTELRNEVVERLQRDILGKIREFRLRGVVIDLSGVSMLDTHQAKNLFDTGKMARLMGAETAFTGLSAGIVISLIDLGFDPGDVLTAIGLEEGRELVRPSKSKSPENLKEDDASGNVKDPGIGSNSQADDA